MLYKDKKTYWQQAIVGIILFSFGVANWVPLAMDGSPTFGDWANWIGLLGAILLISAQILKDIK